MTKTKKRQFINRHYLESVYKQTLLKQGVIKMFLKMV